MTGLSNEEMAIRETQFDIELTEMIKRIFPELAGEEIDSDLIAQLTGAICGTLRLTSAGLGHATMPVRENTREAFHDAVLEQLQEPHQKILLPLLEAYPNSSTPEEVASRAGYSASSGTWRTYLSRLRSLELINRGGDLKAQDWLFP